MLNSWTYNMYNFAHVSFLYISFCAYDDQAGLKVMAMLVYENKGSNCEKIQKKNNNNNNNKTWCDKAFADVSGA